MKDQEPREVRYVVSASDSQVRLDSYVSSLSSLSRSQVQRLIQEGLVRVDGRPGKKDQKVKLGGVVIVTLLPSEPSSLQPEALPLEILFEDDSIIVLNKEAGVVVHPAPGHPSGTLVHALLHHCPDMGAMGGVSRPGIVHRLDKDTSGLLVAAKEEGALLGLSRQFKSRKVKKQYLALVWGEVSKDQGEIEVPIGRDMRDRKKMGVRTGKARAAVTRYFVKERFPGFTWLEVAPETGRTHQIRVHMAYIGHPILGDPVYGGRRRSERSKRSGEDIVANRQMLHAWRLGFAHPKTGEFQVFEAPLPSDFQKILRILQSRKGEDQKEREKRKMGGSF